MLDHHGYYVPSDYTSVAASCQTTRTPWTPPASRSWGFRPEKETSKMLWENPKLSGHINCLDFIFGYTGLHWAGKNGNLDISFGL